MSSDLIKENFYARLAELREARKEQLDEGVKEFTYGDLDDASMTSLGKDLTPGLGTARAAERTKRAWKKGSYGKAALHGADTALSGVSDALLASGIGAGAGAVVKGGIGAVKTAAKLPRIIGSIIKSRRATKVAKATDLAGKISKGGKITDPARLARRTAIAKGLKAGGKDGKLGKLGKFGKLTALGAAGLASAMGGSGGRSGDSAGRSNVSLPAIDGVKVTPQYAGSSGALGTQRDRKLGWTAASRIQNEDTLHNLKMISEGKNTEMLLNDGTKVDVSKIVAKQLLETFNNMNSNNKKIFLEMINKDKLSFAKIMTFSIRN